MNRPVVEPPTSVEIRVRGRVQGAGFRPMVWRHARELRLEGVVLNDAEGLLIRTRGPKTAVLELVARVENAPPPLALVEGIEVTPYVGELPPAFAIVESGEGRANTEVAPDAALCAECAGEIFDPLSRRFRYPFTTCTNCGPRLTVVTRMPYDRANTSMAAFCLCPPCAVEYNDPGDRRFHAETTACHDCGPRARLIRFDGKRQGLDAPEKFDDIEATLELIEQGEIVAIKGLGGYHLACDATRPDVVERLRELKRRDRKPFALMARDIDLIRRYCTVTAEEARALTSFANPIVLLKADGDERLPDAIAPGLDTLGFMLPATPLHSLLLKRMNRPVVMTSGNLSGAPPVISDDDARIELGAIASFALVHDREIVHRVDDSVVRVALGRTRIMRRSRGYAPSKLRLPQGFERAPQVLAMGGDLKSAFCVVKSGAAALSPHLGDLDDVRTAEDFDRSIGLYREMFAVAPALVAADLHPDYRSAALGRKLANASNVPLVLVQHHHAHIASCLAENGRPLDAPPVLGIALDGLGYGLHGEIWGGEFLRADYRGFERIGTFKPVAMLGGDQAAREPWRNLYAHLMAAMSWEAFKANFGSLHIHRLLSAKPRQALDAMLRGGVNAPPASSCGRLFDAVAAAVGICFEHQGYEGEAACQLESACQAEAPPDGAPSIAYPFTIETLEETDLPYIDPTPMWKALLADLVLAVPVGIVSARFHLGLARSVSEMAVRLAERDRARAPRFDIVALSGGCFHNRVLLEGTVRLLEDAGFQVLTHTKVPAGDGGLALGQAAIAVAREEPG